MVEKHQSGAGVKVDRATWKNTIQKINQLQAENPEISSVRCVLPIALIAQRTLPINEALIVAGRRGKIAKNPIIGYGIGWTESLKPNQEVINFMEYVTLNHPVHGRSAYFQIELKRWDKTKFRKNSSGVTHLTKNDRGNVVLRQVIASESAMETILKRFVGYADKFFMQHCELDE